MRRTARVLAVVLFAAVLAACNKSTSTSTGITGPSASSSVSASVGSTSAVDACASAGTVHFAKTKFLLHAGLAFGAFHRYIYNPYKAGSFSAGAQHRTSAIVKAGVAAAFDYHELKLAAGDAAGDSTLCHLGTPFDAAASAFNGLVAKFKGGNLDPTDVTGLTSAVTGLQQQASSLGAQIKDKTASL